MHNLLDMNMMMEVDGKVIKLVEGIVHESMGGL